MQAFLADLIVVVHLGYLGFVVIGELLIVIGYFLNWSWIRNFWFRALHFLAIGIVVLETYFHFFCPLTDWENKLRQSAGQRTEDVSFTGRVAQTVLFWEGVQWDDARLQWSYYAFGGLVLATLLLAPPRLPGRKPDTTPPAVAGAGSQP